MPGTPALYRRRIDAFAREVERLGAVAAVLTPGPDLAYLLGRSVASHERLSCLVVPVNAPPVLLVPGLERPGWSEFPADDVVRVMTWLDGSDPYGTVATIIGVDARADRPLIAVGDHMPAAHALHIRSAVEDAEIILAGPAVSALRVRKTPEEIDALAAAGAAIDRVQARIGEWLRAGRTEHEVAADIRAALVAEGHQRADFVIVGSGPNGASPHHEASDRVIQPGDTVVIDIGGPIGESDENGLPGYFSDCTRTYQVVGEPDPEFVTVYDVVERAQAAGVAAVAPGVAAEDVDRAAREVVESAGYGPYFITRTGHGIGLEVHEEPYIVAGNSTRLAPGMTFSIEPGIYLPGRFGVRIEDIVTVTEAGGQRLNECSRDFTVV
jgi:Xaa-Pro aminopeptidase